VAIVVISDTILVQSPIFQNRAANRLLVTPPSYNLISFPVVPRYKNGGGIDKDDWQEDRAHKT
jgi:hypothetical protein